MAGNSLNLLNALRHSKGDEKIELSRQLEESLEKDPRYIQGAFFSIFNRIIISNLEPKLTKIYNGEFFTVRITTYKDFNSKTHVAIGLSYLQDFDNFDNDLDDKVSSLIIKTIKEENLDIIFNDICVNLIQYRNGVKVTDE